MTTTVKNVKTSKQSLWSGSTVVAPQHMYLKLHVEDDKAQPVPFDHIERAIDAALQAMYGTVGSSVLHYDVMDSDHRPSSITLRTSTAKYQRIWAALTLHASPDRPLRITVVKATPFVFALTDQVDIDQRPEAP